MASRDLKDADAALVAGFLKIKAIFEAVFPKYELRVTTTYRSPAEQKAAFDAGRSQIDGFTKKGMHNYLPSRAIDVGIFRKNGSGMPAAYIDDLLGAKRFDVEMHTALYWIVGLLAQRQGFRWGGDWNGNGNPVGPDPAESFTDSYHLELKA